jgi:hypothetical protein
MMYQGAQQTIYRSPVQIGIRQQLSRRGSLELPGGSALWKAVGKILLVLLPLVFGCQIVLNSLSTGMEEDISEIDNQYYNLMITNSLLKAERTGLLTPEKVESLAGRKIALQKPEKGQVLVYHRASGQFRYL